MIFVENRSANPYFNIACEEYFLKYFEPDIAMLWRSKPSVIVGKHQNTLGEINYSFVTQNSIPVVRRLSGGGTVFHDPGNINFTFIKSLKGEKIVDFRAHTKPIIDFLQSLGIDARFEGKNDLRVNGFKISGNAEHIFKNKVIHHGTLLFNSDLNRLNESIRARENSFSSKAVKSVRSEVANISSFLQKPMTNDEFLLALKDYLIKHIPIDSAYIPDDSDIRTIQKLVDEKYDTWEWNFGYSPDYTLFNETEIRNCQYKAEVSVSRGKIKSVSLAKDGIQIKNQFLRSLVNVHHRPDAILKLILESGLQSELDFPEMKDYLGLFF